jgi:hypothetical protein
MMRKIGRTVAASPAVRRSVPPFETPGWTGADDTDAESPFLSWIRIKPCAAPGKPLRRIRPYKHALVNFIRSLEWHWFITVPIGECPHDDLVLKLLRRIEGHFCKKYVATRYHKLPDASRFLMAVAFEGETRSGSRHAHLLVRVPRTNKKQISQSRLIATFPSEFRFMWLKFRRTATADTNLFPYQRCGEGYRRAHDHGRKSLLLSFARANVARKIYTVKQVREAEVLWSRFEFATPRKFETFQNENLRVIKNRDRQKRLVLGLCDRSA